MKRLLGWVPYAVVVLVFVALVGGCIRWEWRECRQVGHGALYCFVKMGKK